MHPKVLLFRVRQSSHLALAIALFFIIGCDSNDLANANSDELAAANLREGVHKKQVSIGGGKVMRYMVSVPRLTHGRRYPLVLALHGGGPRSPWMADTYLAGQVIPGLEALNAIIVAPDMPGNAWTDPVSDEAATSMIRAILKLDKSWPVDPDRVIITGMSAGGIGTWSMTLKHPDLYSAGIPVATDPLIGNRHGPDEVPLYIIHGDNDRLFDFDGVALEVASLDNLGVMYHFERAAGVSHSNTNGYSKYLKTAAEWVQSEIW